MLPLKDNIPSRTTPIVNYTLIGLCLLAFMVQVSDPDGGITLKWGFIPSRVSRPDVPIVIEHHELVQTPFGLREETARTEVPAPPIPALMTALTCVFLHGSVMHLLGNMWFLYIFGDNVEDRLGHVGYLIFYLACGIAASLTHYLSDPGSTIPTIGASGAIAGVMGAYLLLYPHASVVALVPLGFLIQTMVIPAPFFLGLWFLMQLVQGSFAVGTAEAEGVAWWAHIGGFVVGFAVAWILGAAGQTSPKVVVVRPGTEQRFRRVRTPWD